MYTTTNTFLQKSLSVQSKMDFDDQLIAAINAPEVRTPTPPPPPLPAATSSPTSTNTPAAAAAAAAAAATTPTTASRPRPSTQKPQDKDTETFYIRPIPSGLRAPSLSALLDLCHTHTLQNGFDVVKKAGVKPTTTKSGRKSIIPGASYYKWHITCVLGGKPKNTRHLTEEQRRRDKGSLKQGCPSRVWAWAVDREDPGGEWEVRWGDTDPALHNHPPVDVSTLPNHRRRAREQQGVKEAIRGIVESGVGRKEGMQRLRELFPDALVSEKDVANELQKYRMEAKARKEQGVDKEEGEGEGLEEVDAGVGMPAQQHLQQHQGQQMQPHLQAPVQQHHVFAPGVSAVPGYW